MNVFLCCFNVNAAFANNENVKPSTYCTFQLPVCSLHPLILFFGQFLWYIERADQFVIFLYVALKAQRLVLVDVLPHFCKNTTWEENDLHTPSNMLTPMANSAKNVQRMYEKDIYWVKIAL